MVDGETDEIVDGETNEIVSCCDEEIQKDEKEEIENQENKDQDEIGYEYLIDICFVFLSQIKEWILQFYISDNLLLLNPFFHQPSSKSIRRNSSSENLYYPFFPALKLENNQNLSSSFTLQDQYQNQQFHKFHLRVYVLVVGDMKVFKFIKRW